MIIARHDAWQIHVFLDTGRNICQGSTSLRTTTKKESWKGLFSVWFSALLHCGFARKPFYSRFPTTLCMKATHQP